MATANSFWSEYQYLCPICLEVFTDPVSIPCGHNFCKTCISRHWSDKERCQCPLCKEEFTKGLKLCINTTFRDVVENFKKIYVVPKSETPDKPEDVLCDCCLQSKRKASKTCLMCLASYCETHLESHRRVPALKTRHKLIDPVQNLKDKICSKHNMLLEPRCGTDPTPACALCLKHETAPAEEKQHDQKPPMVNKNEEVHNRKREQRKKAKSKKDEYEAPPNSVNDSEDSSDVFICWGTYFGHFSKVPSNNAISKGRFYYEVHTEGKKSWDLGVVGESMRWRRKSRPKDMNQRWTISLFECSKCKEKNPNTGTIPQRVFVCVDYDQGMVFFCDGDSRSLFFVLHGCRFSQKLSLFSKPSMLMTCPPCNTQHIPVIQNLPVDGKHVVYFFVFIIIIVGLLQLFLNLPI